METKEFTATTRSGLSIDFGQPENWKYRPQETKQGWAIKLSPEQIKNELGIDVDVDYHILINNQNFIEKYYASKRKKYAEYSRNNNCEC